MKTDFRTAIAQIAAERGIPREAVEQAIEHALKTVYRKMANSEEEVSIEFLDGGREPKETKPLPRGRGAAAAQAAADETIDIRVFVHKRVVEEIIDPVNDMLLADAQRMNPSVEPGMEIKYEATPDDFGRIAAQTAKQVVLQRIRDYERETVWNEYHEKEGELLNGTVQRADSRAVIVELGRAEAVMPAREQVQAERYRTGQRLKVMLVEVNREAKGPQLIVSRSNAGLIRRLFEIEVPEIFSGAVEIMALAREPGLRSKVAVTARQANVDPVGSCVGVRGVRIQNIVNELYGEKIDVIEWSPDTATFIANALSPAKPTNVSLHEEGEQRVATVVVPSDQMSLAIGKEGQNARLAFKLTGWKIDIKDSETLFESGGDLMRQARAAVEEGGMDFGWVGRRPALVRADATIEVQGKRFGPLPAELVGMQVDVELERGGVDVYYERELRSRYDAETGAELSLDDDPIPAG